MAAIFAGLLMVGLPSTSLAAHDLRIKKQEQHFTLDSDEQVVTISCDAGYKVVDGMWRIDHADQDDDLSFTENYVTAADVLWAYSDTPTSYTFKFVKNAIGRVQGKVFVTCIGVNTEGDEGHTMAPTFLPAAGAPYQGAGDSGTGLLEDDSTTSANRCGPKWIVIAPGYEVTTASEQVGVGRLVQSGLLNPDPATADNRDWAWKLAAGTTTATLKTTFRCLKLKLDTVGSGSAPAGHRHKIVKKSRWSKPIVAANGPSTENLNCGDAYKAVVAGFHIANSALYDHSLPNYAFGSGWKLWYMGMDPRPKTRSFKFFNSTNSATVAGDLILSATCVNYRST